nr:hypothetical protein [Tanacetum cinerariifolium]
MVIYVISISSNSSKKSVGTTTARVILFSTTPTAIATTVPIVDSPVVHFDTTLIPTKTPTIPPIVSTLLHTSLFLYIDSSDNDTSERPPSQDPYKDIVARWRSRVAARSSPPLPPTRQILLAPPSLPRRPAILVLASQPILVGRPYRTQPNGVRKMLTARKSVRALPSGRLASRYPPDHSSSDNFSLDDSSLDSLSDSSSGYSSDSPSDSSSNYSLVPLATPVPGALSPVHADLLPHRKRIRGAVTTLDYDDNTKESYEAYTEPVIDFDVQEDIDDDTATAEAAAAREANVRVEGGIGSDGEDEAEEEAESKDRDTIKIGVDKVIESV